MSNIDDNVPDDERIPEPTVDDDETSTDPEAEEGDEDQDADADAEQPAAAGEEQSEEPPQRPSRGDRRIAALSERTRALAEENARITRQLDELRRQPPPQPIETPQQRAERLALLSPEERNAAYVDEALQNHTRQQQQVMSQLLDQSDRERFEARTTNNPLLKKLAPRIEQELSSLRARGQNLDRLAIAKYLIGERVLEQQGKAKPAVQARRRQQQARPVNGAGDVPSARRERRGTDTVSDIETRFGDIPI